MVMEKYYNNHCGKKEVPLDELIKRMHLDDEVDMSYLEGCASALQALLDLGLIRMEYKYE